VGAGPARSATLSCVIPATCAFAASEGAAVELSQAYNAAPANRALHRPAFGQHRTRFAGAAKSAVTSRLCLLSPGRRPNHRSSGLPPARHLAREAVQVIIHLAGQAPSRRQPLSSNVRQHHVTLKVLAIASGAAVAAEYRMPSSATVVQARHSKSGNAQVPRSALLPSLLRLQRFAATTLFLSLRRLQSVRGSAATRKALPSFIAGGGGGLSCSCASSPRRRISGQ